MLGRAKPFVRLGQRKLHKEQLKKATLFLHVDALFVSLVECASVG